MNKEIWMETKKTEATQEPMKNVAILLTKYTDFMSRFVCILTRGGYSHVSISIDEKEEEFYSFNFKGFVREYPKRKVSRKREKRSVILRFQIPESSYQIIESEIARHLDASGYMVRG